MKTYSTKEKKDGWNIEFVGVHLCSVNSRQTCIWIIVGTLFLILAPILIISLTYSFAPCLILGLEGKISLPIDFKQFSLITKASQSPII